VWQVAVWTLVVAVWAAKDRNIRELVARGGGDLDLTDPSLSPRDELETATKAANLVNSKLWSAKRGMDAVGVDDPETEQDDIREERTDATLYPSDVMVMAQLMATLAAQGLQPPQGVQGQAQAQLASGQNDLRTALGTATPTGEPQMQSPEEQGQLPPEALVPGATPPGPENAAFAVAPQEAQIQGMITDQGQSKSRILTKQNLGRR
jgi:hypothetical protein